MDLYCFSAAARAACMQADEVADPDQAGGEAIVCTIVGLASSIYTEPGTTVTLGGCTLTVTHKGRHPAQCWIALVAPNGQRLEARAPELCDVILDKGIPA